MLTGYALGSGRCNRGEGDIAGRSRSSGRLIYEEDDRNPVRWCLLVRERGESSRYHEGSPRSMRRIAQTLVRDTSATVHPQGAADLLDYC